MKAYELVRLGQCEPECLLARGRECECKCGGIYHGAMAAMDVQPWSAGGRLQCPLCRTLYGPPFQAGMPCNDESINVYPCTGVIGRVPEGGRLPFFPEKDLPLDGKGRSHWDWVREISGRPSAPSEQ